jgi:hypothetical protein
MSEQRVLYHSVFASRRCLAKFFYADWYYVALISGLLNSFQ